MASHDFISILRNKHSFNLTVFGFSVNTTLIISFRQRIKMIISGIILNVDWSFPLVLKRPVLTILNSLVKLTIKPTVTLIVKRPRFIFTMKQLIKPTLSLIAKKPVFVFVMMLFEKIPSWLLENPPVTFIFSPIVAKFHALWEYDNQTLSTLDSMTLANMDYSETL